jgi:diguanylate cyclase (GGDEF)-like protein
MFRQLLRRAGVVPMSAALTVISVALSLVITALITLTTGGGWPSGLALIIAVVAPLIIAPSMSLQMLTLLSRLDQTEARLRTLAITDDLTQAYNRRYFIGLAEAELARLRRYGGTCTLAIIDLDNFKALNDTAGHLAGDEALRQFSRLCREQLRAADTFSRYGGDEFIALLPATTPAAAQEVVDRIRARVGAADAVTPAKFLTFSAGLAGLDPAVKDLDELVKRADDALYAAKRAGGNQVIIHGSS